MSISTKNSRDIDLQESVVDELQWSPDVDPSHIGVSIHDGAVTLSGEVDSYTELLAAKKAAMHVHGVSVVADELHVRKQSEFTDSDIATAVQHVLQWTAVVPHHALTAEVRDHVVRLSGTVGWDFERQAAREAIEAIAGVRRVDMFITLTERASAGDTAQQIKTALVRNALTDAHAITVTASGSKITLTGHVRSWDEKYRADRAAWASPHVNSVVNKIEVRP